LSPGQAFIAAARLRAAQDVIDARLGDPIYGVDPYAWEPGEKLLAEAAHLDTKIVL
jgi:hypothetical protein